jgi:hypothetical protein
LVTPTINSFVNATHSHQDAAGGGALSAAAITSGTLGDARLSANVPVLTPTDDNIPVGSGSAWQGKAIPNCPDTGGNHLNYDASTNTFSCGTS